MQTVHNFSREDGGSIIAIFGHNWWEVWVMRGKIQAHAKSTGLRLGIIVLRLNILAPAQALLSLAGIRTSFTRRLNGSSGKKQK